MQGHAQVSRQKRGGALGHMLGQAQGELVALVERLR